MFASLVGNVLGLLPLLLPCCRCEVVEKWREHVDSAVRVGRRKEDDDNIVVVGNPGGKPATPGATNFGLLSAQGAVVAPKRLA